MTRPFLMFPDKRLRTVCAPVDAVDDHVRTVWNEMLAAMYAMPGVGLAGPQIGEMLRLAVVDCSDERNEPVRMANPEVLHASVKLREHEEASPNIPGFFAKVERPRAITARYLDENGTVIERDFVGLWATSVQHQIDHLNGKLFVDHLGPVKRKMLLAKHAKNMKRRG
ncbi:MAG: peptide deformylase [Rhodobacteraceae bacterium]|nr:peptide deformylase [Paracoccaceae bacterium]